MRTLYYIHDPMCSWCWAFRPVLCELSKRLPDDVQLHYLLGGLAPDNDAEMDQATQIRIQHHWSTITQQLPHIRFNFDFWSLNSPKRSTYPACRAVIAAKIQDSKHEQAMILAIQQAYYQHALNPSEDDTLIQCATTIGLDIRQFKQDLHSEQCKVLLQNDIKQCRELGVFSFPALVLEDQGSLKNIHVDYNHVDNILIQLQH